MDFSGKIILSYIEEDNTLRAYFRVRPLLTGDGPVTAEEIDSLPDDGYLRVVPDKNEQHTFKERMRELGMLCVLDLYHLPADAVKVRSNKNYAPQKGENNQFIVYSDAVQSLPQQLLYEVVSAEPGEKEKIAASGTPLCYVRSGGKIFGPVSRATGLEQEGASALPPDSEGLFAVSLPDGSERLFYWPRRAKAARPEAREGGEGAASADKTEESKLNGVPLYQTVARRPQNQQRAHNPLIDVVNRQRETRIEAPGAVLSSGAEAQPVENPMDAFKRALHDLWPMPEMQRQAAAHFLSMTGVQNILNQQLGTGANAVSAAMNSQIQDLEAERLALIMQVENAKKDLSALRQEALAHSTREEEEAISRLRQEADRARADLEKIDSARAALLAERDEAVAALEKADPQTACACAEIGGYADYATLCERVQKAMTAAGICCSHNDAVHLLALLCVGGPRIEIRMDTASDALDAARALAAALGVRACEKKPVCEVRSFVGGDSFCLVLTEEAYLSLPGCICILTNAQAEEEEYARAPWPVAYLKTSQSWQFDDAPQFPPVKAEGVRETVLRDSAAPCKETLDMLNNVDNALRAAGFALPQQMRRQAYTYLAATAPHMDGGVAAALDWAATAWLVPHVCAYHVDTAGVRALLQGLPKTMNLLDHMKPNK